MKFEIGDLLRVKDSASVPAHWRGAVGLCIKIMHHECGPQQMMEYDYKVLVGDEGKICFYEKELEIMNKGTGNE